MKDTSIQKRLSWNYGQHIANNELTLQQRKNNTKCLSSDSMHSSSGVSSTGSLHLSIGSEFEDSTASTGTVVTATHIYRNLSSSPSSKEDIGMQLACFSSPFNKNFSLQYLIPLMANNPEAHHRASNNHHPIPEFLLQFHLEPIRAIM